jgi:hypothetical protein
MVVLTNITMQITACRAQIEIEQRGSRKKRILTGIPDESMLELGTSHKTLAYLPDSWSCGESLHI